MKRILLIITLLVSLNAVAQEGISFHHGTWSETVQKAKNENKLIFVDFYTQWCGPCYNMAKSVFTLYSVGSFYNDHFICSKIDAENGEGIQLAKQYAIHSYPTYLFINPNTLEVVHRSSGRQDPDVFMFTGKSAINPKKCSSYFDAQIAAGNKTPELLIDYAQYKGSIYDNDTALKIASELFLLNGYSLENKSMWELFTKYVKGSDNKLFLELVAHKDKYSQLYGTENVDKKIYTEFQFVRPLSKLKSLPNFNGKEVLLLQSVCDSLIHEKRYEDSYSYLDSLMNYKGKFAQDICKYLYYISRSVYYSEYPAMWIDKCFELSRYVAYNNPDRDDATMHYDYALQLESKLKRAGVVLKEPVYGQKQYTLRPLDLKPKPKPKSVKK